MITKERLEELIEQGATIYFRTFNDVREVAYNAIPSFWKMHWEDYENWMFETEEDARWELEMTATRTETLKLPKWEEVKNNGFDYTFFVKKYDMDFEYYFLVAEIDKTIEVMFRQIEHCMTSSAYDVIFNEPLTKENYIEACKLCLRLFKGEKV